MRFRSRQRLGQHIGSHSDVVALNVMAGSRWGTAAVGMGRGLSALAAMGRRADRGWATKSRGWRHGSPETVGIQGSLLVSIALAGVFAGLRALPPGIPADRLVLLGAGGAVMLAGPAGLRRIDA